MNKFSRNVVILTVFTFLFVHTCLFSQQSNGQIRKVHLIFKTHLDIGFTKLSSEVERQYINEFIPNTIAIIEQIRSENSAERYVWTTGSWLIWEYLRQASPEAVEKLETAIRRGDIVWNGVPYTVESEAMNKELFTTCLKLSQLLDRRFGKKTVAAKMTDVPGHTRGIISPMCDAGISFLHIGVNSASAVPVVPPVCRWCNTDGKELILMYQGSYGEDMVLPDGETVVSINLTGDNHGAHSVKQIKDIYAAARVKYPNATIMATSLNEVAKDIQTMKNLIPVVTSEIGDTWIYGFGSSPLRMARYRALSRLYTQWVKTGKLDMDSPVAIEFAVRLGLVPEHTWGLDVKTHLKNWDKYDVDVFNDSRGLPAFKLMEQSWAEQDAYVDKAIASLPGNLQKEANKTLENIGEPTSAKINGHDRHPQIDTQGAYNMSTGGVEALVGELTYMTFSTEDYATYQNSYLKNKPQWAFYDFGKPGLENSKAKSATVVARMENCKLTKSKKNTVVQCSLRFPDSNHVNPSVFPETTVIEYIISPAGNHIEMQVSFRNKPAVRLPEAYLLSFIPKGIQSILAEKMGCMVDVSDVVAGGNRQMHAIDNYIDVVTDKGTVRITSLDAPLAVIGERQMLNYSTRQPDLSQGVHICLFNNLWGTNFSMWWGGSITYRFTMDVIKTNESPFTGSMTKKGKTG